MISFIYGAAGTGKSSYINDRALAAARAGNPVILLVPEQQVLSREAELAHTAGGAVPLGLEVLSFGRLANTVFRREGGLCYSYLTRAGKNVILWRAVQSVAPALRKYGELTLKDRAFLCGIMASIKEFKAGGITPERLTEAAEQLDKTNTELKNKLYDIAVISSAYDAALGELGRDPEDDLALLDDVLYGSDFLRPYSFFIDSFNGYTGAEINILRHIFSCCTECSVTLAYDGGDTVYNALPRSTDLMLNRLVRESGLKKRDLHLDENRRYKDPALVFLRDALFDFSRPPYEGQCRAIKLARARDIYEECEYIAASIHAGVRAGERYRDYAVIVRDIGMYTGVIDRMFEKYSMPHFMSVREDITMSPAVKCVLSALGVCISGWRTDDVFSYLKSGVCVLSQNECNLLENYTETWGITGRRWHDGCEWNMNPDGYTEERGDEADELLERLSDMRRRTTEPLERFFSCFEDGCSAREACESVWHFAEDISLAKSISENEPETAHAVWNALLDALDTIVKTAGDMQVNAELFRELLLTVLSDSDIGRIPAGKDEITVGDASLLRLGKVKHVYVAGAAEGIFPASAAGSSLITDSERKTLEKFGIKTASYGDEKNSEELLYFYRAALSPSDTLTVSCPDGYVTGEKYRPSVGYVQIKKLFPSIIETVCSSLPAHVRAEEYGASFDIAAAERQSETGEALARIYSRDPLYRARLDAMKMPISQTDENIGAQAAEKFFPRDMNMTQSRLDTFSKCEFSYHCKYVLRLKEQKKPDFRTADTGNFVHMLLERFLTYATKSGELRTDIDDAEINETVNNLTDEYIRNIFIDPRAVPVRLSVLLERIRRTSVILIKNILREFADSDFRPAFFEMSVSDGSDGAEPYTVHLPDGGTVKLRGRLDRIDTYKRGNDVYIRIVDYKTGNHELSVRRIEHGQDMQMLLYLFALWKTNDKKLIERLGAQNGQLLPAGAQYYIAKSPSIVSSGDESESELEESAVASVKRNGLYNSDPEIIRAMSRSGQKFYSPSDLIALDEFGRLLGVIEDNIAKTAEQMKTGSARAQWNARYGTECSYCPMRAVCRKERE